MPAHGQDPMGLWVSPSLPGGCQHYSRGDGMNNCCIFCAGPWPWHPPTRLVGWGGAEDRTPH